MSARPDDGVLDRQLAVHGFEDLFVASSSAFVTSSQANSTVVIVVFALRLAEHLHRTLRSALVTTAPSNGIVRDTNHRSDLVVGDVVGGPSRTVGDKEPI
jgi:hypothetical protein